MRGTSKLLVGGILVALALAIPGGRARADDCPPDAPDFGVLSSGAFAIDGCPADAGPFGASSSGVFAVDGCPADAGPFGASSSGVFAVDGCPVDPGPFAASSSGVFAVDDCPPVAGDFGASSSQAFTLDGCLPDPGDYGASSSEAFTFDGCLPDPGEFGASSSQAFTLDGCLPDPGEFGASSSQAFTLDGCLPDSGDFAVSSSGEFGIDGCLPDPGDYGASSSQAFTLDTTCPTVIQVAAGDYHTVALKSDGTAWAWGYNNNGQLGDGTTTSRSTPVRVLGLSGVTAIAAGQYHTVALASDGTVWAWGNNVSGQLGDGTTTQRTTPVQVRGPGGIGYLAGVTAIAGGGYHTVALGSDSTVWAWGNNYSGQLGDGTNTNRSTPVQVSGLTGVVTAIAAGYSHTVALKGDSKVWAWGRNYNGQLGDGTPTDRSTPVQVSGLTGVTDIAAGDYHTVALKGGDGAVWTWGYNNNGQLGDGTTTQRRTPVQVRGYGGTGNLTGVTAIAGGGSHTVALKGGGTVWAWGSNAVGQLGDGTTTQRTTPVQVSTLSGVTAIAAGLSHTVALKGDGTVWDWGYNNNGQLGDGTTTNRSTPVQVIGLYVTGSVTINGGATGTTTEAVTLTLSATACSDTVTQMRVSNDGIFDTEPLEAYTTSKSWTLPSGEGTKTVYVRFMSSSGSESGNVTATIILDTTAPTITLVTVSPSMAAAGDLVHVTVNVTDLAGVASVTAGGAALAKTGDTTWTGGVTAAPELGSHSFPVVATDVVGHSTNATGSYNTAAILGTAGRSLADPIVVPASSRWLFKMWGKVTTIDANSFYLDDGSTASIRVIAPGYSGIGNGDYVSVRGILIFPDPPTDPPTLQSEAVYVVKHN